MEPESGHNAWFDVLPPHHEAGWGPIPACGMPSPTGRMLCDLPEVPRLPGQPERGHYLRQHVGIDKRGNFRGWPDKRGDRATQP